MLAEAWGSTYLVACLCQCQCRRNKRTLLSSSLFKSEDKVGSSECETPSTTTLSTISMEKHLESCRNSTVLRELSFCVIVHCAAGSNQSLGNGECCCPLASPCGCFSHVVSSRHVDAPHVVAYTRCTPRNGSFPTIPSQRGGAVQLQSTLSTPWIHSNSETTAMSIDTMKSVPVVQWRHRNHRKRSKCNTRRSSNLSCPACPRERRWATSRGTDSSTAVQPRYQPHSFFTTPEVVRTSTDHTKLLTYWIRQKCQRQFFTKSLGVAKRNNQLEWPGDLYLRVS